MKYTIRKHETKKLEAALNCHKHKRPFLAGDTLGLITGYQVREDSLVLELKEISL